MESPIITLTTDWGYRDFFAGMVKGKLMSALPNARIIDITHGIEPYNLNYATFVVKHACLGFPKGTIHIIDVDSVETADNPFVVVEYNDQYFICTDNGLPYVVFGNEFQSVTRIDKVYQDRNEYYTFAVHDLFCKVAAMIANGEPMENIGFKQDGLYVRNPLNYIESPSRLQVYVSYIDNYGNAYLNITLSDFERLRNGRNFRMMVHEREITRISQSYNDNNENADLLLTVSTTGYLELALKQASASQLLSLSVREGILVYFQDPL